MGRLWIQEVACGDSRSVRKLAADVRYADDLLPRFDGGMLPVGTSSPSRAAANHDCIPIRRCTRGNGGLIRRDAWPAAESS